MLLHKYSIRSKPGAISYECVNWEQSVANGALHSAIGGRPVASKQFIDCSSGEWRSANEHMLNSALADLCKFNDNLKSDPNVRSRIYLQHTSTGTKHFPGDILIQTQIELPPDQVDAVTGMVYVSDGKSYTEQGFYYNIGVPTSQGIWPEEFGEAWDRGQRCITFPCWGCREGSMRGRQEI